MSKTNTDRFRDNKAAFDEIIGDPYGLEETIGKYIIANRLSSIKVMDNDFGGGSPATRNEARPSTIDFCCDVERAVDLGLTRFDNSKIIGLSILRDVFYNTYIAEDDNKNLFNQKQRVEIEQIIGRLFLERQISPVSHYFLTIRKKLTN